MSEKKVWCMAGASSEFGNAMPEAILNYPANIAGKTGNPKFIETFRLLTGFLIMLAGLYFGLFTTGASEGLGFLALLASPFVMVIDRD